MPPRISRRAILAVTAAYLVSRAIFHAIGIRFDASRMATMWQFLDVNLLRTDLARSLYYLHGQPPLYDLLIGAALKLAPDHPEAVFHAAHLGLGWLATIAILALLRRLGASRGLSVAATCVLMVSPAFVLYETWLCYTWAELALLASAALLLHRWIDRRRARDALLFFTSLSLLVLLRSAFHLGFLLAVAALVAIEARRRRRTIALVAAGPVLAATLWYAKNLAVFGSFSSSTWLGMNLARMAVETIPPRERDQLIARGTLSPIAKVGAFRVVDAYGLPKPAKTGVPVLDAPIKSKRTPNLNHLAYIELSRRSMKDARRAIVARPDAYLRGVGRAITYFVRSPTDYWMLSRNQTVIARYDALGNAALYLSIGRVSLLVVAAIPIAIASAIAAWIRRRGRAPAPDRATSVTLLFMAGTIVYVTLVSTLLDAGENNRFRFPIDPYLAIFAVLAARAAARRLAARLAPSPSAPPA